VGLALVLASALGMAAVVVVELRRTVDEQAARARAAARRDAEREAGAVREALLSPDVLARVPEAARFELAGGRVVVPAELGGLDPQAGDPTAGLDVVAAERLRRAVAAPTLAAMLAETEKLGEDAAVPRPTQAWLAAAVAWRAHRDGDVEMRDRLLASPLLARVDPPAALASASALLLQATREPAMPASAVEVVKLLPAAHARALCARLAGLGLDVAPLAAVAVDAARRRAVLRRADALAARLAGATAPIARAEDGDLLLYAPEVARGALLDPAQAHSLATALLPPGATSSLAADPARAGADAVPVVAGLVALVPATPPAPGPFAGATGTALLLAALALLCGAGSVLALRAHRRAAESIRARAEFLTLVTHELKTPLAGVRLVGELLADGHVEDPAERAAWLARLGAETTRLSLLIENVLDLGRLERRERAHAPAPLDLGAFVADTLALAAPLLARDGFALLATQAEGLVVHADASTLRQALLNLLDNARKYGRPPVQVVVRHDGGEAVVSVRDHGDGVPAAERGAVFARFARGGAHRHGAIPGVGLGLHLARAIAERHGGKLVYREPERGAGACFELRLPCAGDETRSNATLAATSGEGERP